VKTVGTVIKPGFAIAGYLLLETVKPQPTAKKLF
jgi:hypothetical protein